MVLKYRSNTLSNDTHYDSGYGTPLMKPDLQQKKKAHEDFFDEKYDKMSCVQVHSISELSDNYCTYKKNDLDCGNVDYFSGCCQEPEPKTKIVVTYKFRISPLFALFMCLSTAYFASNVLFSSNMSNAVELTDEEKRIQQESRKSVLDKFGPGPHFVRFDMDFSQDDNDISSFVVKLAPLSEMPHSVHTFLEMVDNGLWDGCSFSINGGHLLMASPMKYDGNHENLIGRFRDANLVAPAFAEYSPSHPHRKYTLGFLGTRKGPEFYINTADNTEIHGPGQQDHHQDHRHAEPCFGTIVSGLETIRRMRRMPLSHGVWIETPVGIRSASVIFKQ